jgi:hypothetical protein
MGNQTETIPQNLLSCPHPLIDSPASKWTATRHRDSLATLTVHAACHGDNGLGIWKDKQKTFGTFYHM